MGGEQAFPGDLTAIPRVQKTDDGWFDPRQSLPVVHHGAGYGRFVRHLQERGADADAAAQDLSVLLAELSLDTAALEADPELACAADIFLGNAINVIYGTSWFPSVELVVASDGLSVDVDGSALLLARAPQTHRRFIDSLS